MSLRPLALVLLAVSVARVFAAPVINEIMYRPGTTYPENTGLEFVELHNPGTAAVDLSGWAFTDGVAYTFPAGTTLPAGGFLVVASNPTTLAASGGYSGALGPWTGGDKLSNNGETITLSQPNGSGGWTTIDEVDYADEGDWAVRTRDSLGGWSWVTTANTGGRSLERRNPALASTNGQNWAPSGAAGGTPGAVNSQRSTNLAPVISAVKHSPAVPTSTEPVTISCRLADESAATALTAILYWRNATSTSPGTFQTAAMTGDGTGRFTAVLAALADKQIVEFYVSASDGTNTRTWPAATSEGQNANCTYQVDNEVVTGTAPVYRLVLTAAENAAFTSLASSNPQSDRMFALTLVATRGADTTIRYRTSMRMRGNSSRQYSIKPLRISLPTDDRWDGVSDFLIGPRGAPWQYLAHKIQRAAGLVAADVSALEVRRQGVEYAVTTGSTADYGQLVRVEEINGDYVDNHWPDAVSGQIYRKTAVTSWASTGSAPADPEGIWGGWSKQNNSGANDWSDVRNFCTVWQAACAPHFTGATAGNVASGTWNNTPFTDAEMTTLSQVADLDYMARWLALMTILPNNEPNLSTGEDDDYAAAFVNDGTATRMVLVPHDMDTTFGTGEQAFSATAVGLYDATETDTIARAGAGSVTLMKPLLPLLGNSTTAGNAAFRAKYLTAIRELLGSVFDSDTTASANPPFHQFVDNHLAEWVPAANRAAVKTFMTQRQTYLLGLIGAAKIAPAAGTSSATKAAAATPTLRLNEVLASNTSTQLNGTTYPDVIELHNSGAAAIDLAGKRLGDSGSPTAYTFPAGTTILAGGYLTVFADSDTAAPGLHTGFALDAEGDAVFLYDTAASGGALLDSLEFGYQLADKSLSRLSASAGTWGLTAPTLGAANGAALALGTIGSVKLNEWAGRTAIRADEDFLELHNAAASPIALGGTRLTDDVFTRPSRYVFPALSFIAAGGHLVLDTDRLDFGLDADFDMLFFAGENGAVLDRADFSSQQEDHSTGRTTDGATAWSDFAVPTPGLANDTALPAAYSALLANLRITEVQYKPVAASSAGDYEFVELKNIGPGALDLGGVRFTNGIDYTFAAGTTLAAGAQIVVCKSRTAFLARYPAASGVLASGNFTGALDNSGETLALTLPAPWDVNILKFRYESTWYALTNTSGYSLVVPAPATSAARDWDEQSTWAASATVGGNPGGFTATTSSIAITSATTASATVGSAFSYAITASETPTGYGATGLPAGLAVSTSTGAITGTPTTAGSYAVTLTASTASSSATATLTLTVSAAVAAGQASAISAAAGSNPVLSVVVTGAGTVAYQWQIFSGGSWIDLGGATASSYTVGVSISATYRVVVTANGVSTAAATTAVTFTGAGGSDAQFAALSTRAIVGNGDAVLVPGFAITGATKRILVRALGPKLTEYGLTGVLADPQVSVTTVSGTPLASSDNWDNSGGTLGATFTQVGLPALTAGSKDAALIVSLPPGVYTATVSGVGGGTGLGLVEFYDLDVGVGRLAAISTRAQVGTGSNVLIPGIAITGNVNKRVIVRAGGPFLTGLGVSGSLADPKFEVKNSAGTTLVSNDNWNGADATLSTAVATVGLLGFAAGSKDAALIADLPPGTYTILVSGVGETSGVALVEVYELP